MRRPVASIVIPLKAQQDDWLHQCILSAVRQTVPCEVVIVIHPATPVSNRNVIRDLQRKTSCIVVKMREVNAFAAAINQGFELATTERIGLLHSDDWIEPDTLTRCVERRADIVCTGMTYFDHEGRVFHKRVPTLREFEQLETLQERASYMKHFFLFNRSKLKQVGGVDETIGNTGPDDYDLIWTLLEHGATADFVEATLYNYRDHVGTRLTLRDRSAQVLDLCKILDKHGVAGSERERLIAESSRWYGQPSHVVLGMERGVGSNDPQAGAVRRGDSSGSDA